MRVGDRVTTLPTVRPKLYAGKQGVVYTRVEDEWGVLVNGRVTWFKERELVGNGPSAASQATENTRDNGHSGGATNGHAMAREESPVQKPSSSRLRGSLGASETMAPVLAPSGPLTNPPRPVNASGGASALVASDTPSRPAHGLSGVAEGSRGPSGGIIAKCGECGGVWERPKTRGRPARVCGECRQ